MGNLLITNENLFTGQVSVSEILSICDPSESFVKLITYCSCYKSPIPSNSIRLKSANGFIGLLICRFFLHNPFPMNYKQSLFY